MFRKILPAFIFNQYLKWRLAIAYRAWKTTGAHIPPPHSVKQYYIIKNALRHNIKVFVETGTYKGDMPFAMRSVFNALHSIELDTTLFETAKERFIKEKNIQLYLGDSSLVLPEIIKDINEPCLFWLDGHYSGGITAKGEKITPIKKELQILSQRDHKDIILIDDARLFNGTDDYPDINTMLNIIRTDFPNGEIRIGDDIISILRK